MLQQLMVMASVFEENFGFSKEPNFKNGYGVGVGKVPEKEYRPKGKKRHRNKKKRKLRHKGGR